MTTNVLRPGGVTKEFVDAYFYLYREQNIEKMEEITGMILGDIGYIKEQIAETEEEINLIKNM